MKIPDNVLDGYPTHLAAYLPDLRGRKLKGITSGKQRGRGIFLAYFPQPPWQCEICGGFILYTEDCNWGDSLNVHHANRDKQDHRLINLAPTHHSCHARYHAKRRPHRGKSMRSP